MLLRVFERQERTYERKFVPDITSMAFLKLRKHFFGENGRPFPFSLREVKKCLLQLAQKSSLSFDDIHSQWHE
jgi:primosomal protein N''